jgi:hypothetical protein
MYSIIAYPIPALWQCSKLFDSFQYTTTITQQATNLAHTHISFD